jgi:serine/threonine protein phosphatase PrpC
LLVAGHSLGDFAFKRAPACEPAQQIVSAFPDVRRHPRKGKGGEILILCSDGVWDVMSSKDVCAYMREAVSKAGEGSNAKDLLEVVLVFLNMCIHKRGTQDNVTAIVVQFAPEEVPLGTKDSAEAEEEEGEECRGDGPNPLTDPIAIDTSVL